MKYVDCGSGCPLRIANDQYIPEKGDTVVDLGCGAGHDSLLAGGLLGSSGKVFCIDFTQAMLIDQVNRNTEEYTESVKDLLPFSFQFLQGSIDQTECSHVPKLVLFKKDVLRIELFLTEL